MRVLRVIGKVILFPFMIIGIILQWIGSLFVGIASVILRVIAGIALLITAVSYFLGIVPGSEVVKIGVISIAVLILSIIGKAGVMILTAINERIRDLLFS